MRKGIIKGLTIAMAFVVLATGVTTPITTTSNVEAATKVITIDEAAKKVVNTIKKACKQKKKVTTTFTVKCSSKKKADQIRSQIDKVVVAIELGNLNGTCLETLANHKFDSDMYDYYKSEETYKNGKLTFKYTVNGKDKECREVEEELEYDKKNVKELMSVTEGMTQKQKAWRVAVWLMTDHNTKYVNNGNLGKYDQRGNGDQSAKAVYENRAGGACSQLAKLYNWYARTVGVKGLGTTHAKNHEINCIKIDGEIFYFDMQGVDEHHGDWEWGSVIDTEAEDYTWIADSDPTGKYSKVPSWLAGNMEDGVLVGYPWELSEEDYCMYPESVAKKRYKDMMGNMKNWKYEWVK